MSLARRARDRAQHVKWLRQVVQATRVALAVRPPWRFVLDLVRGAKEGTYRSSRTGQTVHLRPRLDLQVAREHLSQDGYELPEPVRRALEPCRPLRIADLGANIGLFTLAAAHAHGPGTRIVAVEPDPDNLRYLNRNVADNHLGDAVSVVPAAAAIAPGVLRFNTGLRELSRAARGDETGAGILEVDAIDAFPILDDCDFLKLDIEGGEWAILADPRLATAPLRAIALEWHGRAIDHPAPEEEADRLLRAAGFETTRESFGVPHLGFIWGWRSVGEPAPG